MIKRVLLITFALILWFEYSTQSQKFKIYNGEQISNWEENPFRFLVLLTGNISCTGIIYNTKTVISAGHCFMNEKRQPSYILLEFIKPFTTSGAAVDIKEAFVQERYKKLYSYMPVNGYDVASVRLNKTLDFVEFRLAEVKFSNIELAHGAEVIITGYGKDLLDDNPELSLKRGQAIVKTCPYSSVDKSICVDKDQMFSSQDLSKGDSGSPLITQQGDKYFVHGIHSGHRVFRELSVFALFSSYKINEEFIKNPKDLLACKVIQ